MNQTDVIIVGCGGQGRELAQLIEDINAEKKQFNLLGFVDDDKNFRNSEINGYPVLGTIESVSKFPHSKIALGIGIPKIKRKIIEKIKTQDQFVTLIHPSSQVGRTVELGLGCIVTAGCVLTTNIKVGFHVLFNWNCTVGHDSLIGNFCSLFPDVNISGGVKIGAGCELGTKTVVIPKKSIGDWTITGAGSVVISDVESNLTIAGVPARVIKKHPEGWHLV